MEALHLFRCLLGNYKLRCAFVRMLDVILILPEMARFPFVCWLNSSYFYLLLFLMDVLRLQFPYHGIGECRKLYNQASPFCFSKLHFQIYMKVSYRTSVPLYFLSQEWANVAIPTLARIIVQEMGELLCLFSICAIDRGTSPLFYSTSDSPSLPPSASSCESQGFIKFSFWFQIFQSVSKGEGGGSSGW